MVVVMLSLFLGEVELKAAVETVSGPLEVPPATENIHTCLLGLPPWPMVNMCCGLGGDMNQPDRVSLAPRGPPMVGDLTRGALESKQ